VHRTWAPVEVERSAAKPTRFDHGTVAHASDPPEIGESVASETPNTLPPDPAWQDNDGVAEAITAASQAIDALTARCLASVAGSVTIPQFRALSAIAAPDPHRLADLAQAPGVTPSTATRMCDRLVARGLLRRARAGLDRRELDLSHTPAGQQVVDVTRDHCRRWLSELLSDLPGEDRMHLIRTLEHISRHAKRHSSVGS
jgi:DNA-binding MarR family transcriptional regulator